MASNGTTTEFRVLIVDDDADLAANLRDILEDVGYVVAVASGGRSALALFREQAYDLALVDIRMPDMSGVDLVDSCSSTAPETDFIMVTGHATLDSAITAVKHERVIGYETKPVDVDRLLAMIGQVSERKRAQAAFEHEASVARILLDSMPCIALLMRPGTREIVAANEAAVKAGAVIGQTCYSSWANREEPCPWCRAPAVWAGGPSQQQEVDVAGTVWDAHWKRVSDDLYLHYALDITGLKLVEEELRASEAAKQAILDAVPDMMFRVSRDGRYLDFVPGYGVTPFGPAESFLGRSITDLMPPDVAVDQLRCVKDALASGVVQTVQYQLEVDGHLHDYETRFTAIGKDEVLAIARDTTERASSERALRNSEERFRTIFESSPAGIIITGQSGDILAVNHAYASMLGYSSEELVGKTLADLLNLAEEPAGRKRRDELVRGDREHYRVEKRYHHRDGRIIWGDVVVSAVRDTDGLFQYSVGIVNDITERKRIEEALRDSERNFRNSLDDSPLGVRIVSAHGELLYANRAILDMYGYEDLDRLRNTPTRERYTPESYVEHVDRREKRLRGDCVPTEYEIRIARGDGEVRHLSVIRKAVVWDGEEQFQVLYQDVTELKKTQEQLQHSQLLASLGEMTAGIAHEVNNPLGSVLLYSELVMAGGVSPQTKKDLRVIRDEARRASRIMSDLLTYGRRTTTGSRRLDVHRVVRKVLDMRRYEQKVVDIIVEDDLATGPLHVLGNVSQLTQLFVNLILNAEEALEAGNGHLIRLSSQIEGDWARISVIDDGTGIPEELLNQVFYPFFTTKHAEKGTGLGLSACYGIVTAHHGLISAENNEMGGATFTVELPLGKPRVKWAPAGGAGEARRKRN